MIIQMKRNQPFGRPVLALGLALPTSSLSAADLVNRVEPDWWLTPRRMIQTNLREKVNAFVNGKNSNLAICTYAESGVDVVRKESHTVLDT